MIDFRNIEGLYFIGIGGIGMSALASYFSKGGFIVAGYDRTDSSITDSLVRAGCQVTFDDDPLTMPAIFRNTDATEKVLIVFTPAIPAENKIITWFRKNNYNLYKRSEILGEISRNTDTIAIAG